VSASLQGLSVIRAFKAERHLQKQFDNLQNMQSCVYYLYRAMFYSFAFWTDITCAFYASVLVLYLFLSETGKSIGVLSGASTNSLLQQFRLDMWVYL
jgi:ATP-binding cassette subfamily C (CFTR/MRP) protein 4